MTIYIPTATRAELLAAIASEPDLAARIVNADTIATEDLRSAIEAWIEAGDEAMSEREVTA